MRFESTITGILSTEQHNKMQCVRELWDTYSKWQLPVKVLFHVHEGSADFVKVECPQRHAEIQYSVRMNSVEATYRDTIRAISQCMENWQ